jgi:transposase-like protein
MAVALVVNAKKGISAKQLQRDLNVNYRTAWYLYHRIREAMQSEAGIFTGTVEADAAFIGGKYDKRRKRAKGVWEGGKQPVFGILERGKDGACSSVHTQLVRREIQTEVLPLIERHVAKDAMLYTDEHGAYRSLNRTRLHQIVIHSRGEYVQGDCHTNSLEGFWGLFKRGLIGQYHRVSVKHLSRYLNEFSFRFNNREAEDLFGLVMLNLVIGKALTYAELTAKTSTPAIPAPDADDQPF